jgi:HrpA-like RNA helicase
MTKEIYQKFGVDVIVTEPTVINAIQIPEAISKLYKMKFGENLGYYTSAKAIVPFLKPSLMFVTQEIMTNRIRDPSLTKLPPMVIVMDEAHHASV